MRKPVPRGNSWRHPSPPGRARGPAGAPRPAAVAGAELLGFPQNPVRGIGRSVVVATHDPTAAAPANRVLFPVEGRIVTETTDPNADRAPRRIERLDAHGAA